MSQKTPDAIRASRRFPHRGRGIEPFLRSALLDTIRRLGRHSRTAPRNNTRADVREHGARLKRVLYSILKQYSSSAAACNGASLTYGARQPRVIHHCKQYQLVARVRSFSDERHRLQFGSVTNSKVPLFGYLAYSGPFSKREVKTKVRAECDSHWTRHSDASTSPGGSAAGVLLRTPYRHAVLRIAAAFGPRTPHILRRSCAVSLQNRALKTARSCFEPDVWQCLAVLNPSHNRRSNRHTVPLCGKSDRLFTGKRKFAQR